MSHADHCPTCHGEWTESSPGGLCPACLMRLGLLGGGEDDPLDAEASPRIRIIEEIARGSMGTIYRGRDDQLGRDVAVKLLREDYQDDPGLRRRFLAEAQIAGQLQHPGIVAVYEFGRLEGDRPYIAMKLVEGRTLADLLRERPDPSRDRVRFLSIFLLTCHALAYAHSRRVVHRDLKPANIMVGPFGEVQVMDWGLAKVLPGVEVRTLGEIARPDGVRDGTVLGTPAYMSPEQADGASERVDERSDVFSLGVILYEILTGQTPFRSDRFDDCLKKLRGGELAAPRAVCPGVPRDLEILCLKCLERNPDRRYARASELADDLERFLEGRAIAARPVGAVGLTTRWVHRNRALTAAMVVAVASLLALAAGGMASAVNQADLRERAEVEARRARESEALANRQRDFTRNHCDTTVGALIHLSQIPPEAPRSDELAALKLQIRDVAVRQLRAYLDQADPAGEPPLEVLKARYNLARLLTDYGRHKEAREWYARAADLSVQIESAGVDISTDLLTLARYMVDSHNGLAASLLDEGKPDLAIDVWRSVRQISLRYQSRFPHDHRLWFGRYAILGNLGTYLEHRGRPDDGDEIQQVKQERAIVEKQRPPDPGQ